MKHASALVLIGASGVGKNTVAEALLSAEDSPFSYIRSLCTREPRSTFAEEYIYVGEEEFLRRVENGEMLEHTRYGGCLYGTPISEVERVRREEKIPLMILDINGVESIRRDYPDFPIYAVYLYADPIEVRRRLEKRDLASAGQVAAEKVLARLRSNREDFLSLSKGRVRLFDAFVENRDLSVCVKAVLQAYHGRRALSEAEAADMRSLFDNMAKSN